MHKVQDVKDKIAEHAHPHSAFMAWLILCDDKNAAFYTSKFLIQDTADAIGHVCCNGFSSQPSLAYIEFWGLFQALIIQQDAISELYKLVLGNNFGPRSVTSAWKEVRSRRNELAGHPVVQGGGQFPKRTFMGRSFGNLDRITFEQFSGPQYSINNATQSFNLRDLINRYEVEAANELDCVFADMQKNWP